MKRSGPIPRDLNRLKAWKNKRKRIKPFGKKAKRDRKSGKVFGDLCSFARELACIACHAPPPSDPHHVRSRGAGFGDWLPNGDGNVIPLCRSCHDMHHNGELADGLLMSDTAIAVGEAFKNQGAA